MELVEERCRAHPMLLDALRHLGEYSEDKTWKSMTLEAKSLHFSTLALNL